jgi:hypothetical protein
MDFRIQTVELAMDANQLALQAGELLKISPESKLRQANSKADAPCVANAPQRCGQAALRSRRAQSLVREGDVGRER